MPCLAPESLALLVAARDGLGDEATAMLTAWVDDPHGLGRVLREADDEGDDQGAVRGIVEERDATDAERAIHEVNLGVYAFPGAELFELLPRLSNDNAQREYYLTDVIGMLVAEERPVVAVELEDLEQSVGVNTLSQLAEARWVLQLSILEQHMANGVFIEDPASTWIDHGVTIGRGTRILPATVIRAGVTIGEDCEVGPFTHLRVGTVLEDEAEVGNFTECKQSTVGRRSKAKHLSYLGDTVIGEGANIGAGTIFANYDGKTKHRSVVEDGAFVGSGTVVVAPNRIGKGATTGAGAVLTRGSDVKAGEVWVGVPARRLEKR
jgi:bifunctional UDP-N-acetylglucosamine pyrophosphorylase/glucosamine-1-phosphate N-acetyltransferase